MHNLITLFLKPRVRYAKWLLLLLVIAFFSLGFLDYLELIESFLSTDRFSFQIGDIKFSLYLLLKGALTLIVLFWVTGIFADFGERRIKRIKGVRASNKALLTKALQIFIYFIAFLMVMNVMSIDLSSLAVIGGAVGIGIGFGLQKITSNFISGIILLFEKSIEDDDLIELIDGTLGTIKHISARYTLIESSDGKEIMIPNEDFVTNRVINWTYSNTKGRIQVTIGVSYKSDIELAHKLIIEAASEHPRCSAELKPECFLREFGNSSVNFLLLFWVDDINKGRNQPQSDVMFSIWRKFQENNIEIPFLQLDIHYKEPINTVEKSHR